MRGAHAGYATAQNNYLLCQTDLRYWRLFLGLSLTAVFVFLAHVAVAHVARPRQQLHFCL